MVKNNDIAGFFHYIRDFQPQCTIVFMTCFSHLVLYFVANIFMDVVVIALVFMGPLHSKK